MTFAQILLLPLAALMLFDLALALRAQRLDLFMLAGPLRLLAERVGLTPALIGGSVAWFLMNVAIVAGYPEQAALPLVGCLSYAIFILDKLDALASLKDG